MTTLCIQQSLPFIKHVITPLPNTFMPPPAIPSAVMAPLTEEESANDPKYLPPGYEAIDPKPFLSLPAKLRMQM